MVESDESLSRASDDDMFEDVPVLGGKSSSQKDASKDSPSKRAAPKVKKFEEDILEDEDWLLSRGETLKAEGMIVPDAPDRVKKMQAEDLKVVQNNILSATSYVDSLVSNFKPRAVRFDES